MELRNNLITVREILANPNAKAILQRELPDIMGSVWLKYALDMPLKRVLRYAEGKISRDKLARILEKLKSA